MSGDSHTNDDADFLDEDFVVEDIAGKNDDLEDLFEEPVPNAPAAAGGARPADAPADEDDLLFTDHTEGLQTTEAFESGPTFAEDAASQWNGELLDLETVGVPEASLEGEENAVSEPDLSEAEHAFSAELDSLLETEDDFDLDSEAELQLVDSGDGISEFEQSGPFVLDDREGEWSDEQLPATDAAGRWDEAAAESEEDASVLQSLSSDEGGEEEQYEKLQTMSFLDALGQPTGGQEAGWEPLPAKSVDDLSEVDEVQHADGEEQYDTSGYESDEEEYYEEPQQADYAPAGVVAHKDLEDVDGHDIYGDDEIEPEAVVLGGGGHRRGRWKSVVLSLAASLMIMVCGATVVLRPEWFGLRFEPERVERVEVPRPRVEVVVPEPQPLLLTSPQTGPDATTDGGGAAGTGEVVTGQDGTGQSDAPLETPAIEPPPTVENGEVLANGGEQKRELVDPDEVNPEKVNPEKVNPEQVNPEQVNPEQVDPELVGPDMGTGLPVVSAPPSVGGENSWPVAETNHAQPVAGETVPELARFGDGLMVGNLAQPASPISGTDGVMPGSRAFAQLHNGNYFIGSVKHVAADAITLRVETGEVTLATVEIAQLTRLGSTDYDELQKATKGFIRLTNNNRLIGGILSRIADDHVVLEFRSNRVMLPRSVVGEIVSGEGEDAVRLDTTIEEDSWLRQLAERQLGTGRGAELVPSGPKTGPSGSPPR